VDRSRSGNGIEARKWDERDTWVAPDVKALRKARKRKRIEEGRSDLMQEGKVDKDSARKEKKVAVHRELRGWSNDPLLGVSPLPVESVELLDVGVDTLDPHAAEIEKAPSLSLRIFGRARQRRSPSPTEMEVQDRGLSLPPPQMNGTGAHEDYEENPWGVDLASKLTTAVELPVDSTNLSKGVEEATLGEKARRREKLLGKLSTEKTTSARARAVLSRPIVIGENEVAERLAAADDAATASIPIDKEAIEARAKARLKLKLKLTKEKATMGTVGETTPLPTASSTGDTPPSGADRAAMLRAKLLAARKP
jgi:hypothetical protein